MAEIPIYLGQVIYDQHGLVNGAAINEIAQRRARRRCHTLTNANGEATFVIRGTETTDNPVYFEANLVNLTKFYPYGYSGHCAHQVRRLVLSGATDGLRTQAAG